VKTESRVAEVNVKRVVLPALQIAAAVCALSSLAHGQTPAAIARGRELAERACGGCHAINGGSGGVTIQGINVPSFRAIAGRPNQTPQRLQSFIMTPHRPMPGMPLSLAEVDDIVAYLLTLR
jgi:mono/diheme cytochrome c family protein